MDRQGRMERGNKTLGTEKCEKIIFSLSLFMCTGALIIICKGLITSWFPNLLTEFREMMFNHQMNEANKI